MSRPLMLGNRKVGIITSDNKLLIFRNPKHYFKLYDGWGIAERAIQNCIDWNVTEIILKIHHEYFDYVMTVSPSKWKDFGIKYQHPKFEEQIILPETYFTQKKMVWRKKKPS